MQKYIFLVFTCTLLIIACQKDDNSGLNPPNTEEPTSSWELIQRQIFEPNCVACHTAGTTFANQSGLVLTEDVAYENLVDKLPKNPAAVADGLMLLEQNGLPSLYTSFLWEKINAPNQDHFYQDHPEYGEIMPLGTPPLTNGELEYIRQWIVAGAPKESFVVDEAVLEDDTRFEPPAEDFVPLAIPVSGVQLHLGPFQVAPNYERELFQYQKLNNTEDLYVNNIEIAMRKGSHHFILYDYPSGDEPIEGEIRDLRDENGNDNFETLFSMRNQIFVFGTQFRNTNYTYPEGVALKIPAGQGFDLNSHYVNYGDSPVTGEVYVNLNTVDPSKVEHEAEELFLSKTSIFLPANQETTLKSEFTFSDKRHVFLLTSHAHRLMKEFRIFIKGGARDGELVYFTNDWEHPALINFEPAITLNPGEGLRAEAVYDNYTDQNVSFGLKSTDEMMIIFGAYYKD